MKPEYKQTEVGVIPNDWEVRTIDQVGLVTSGKRLPLGSFLVARATPHPYVRVTDMRPGTVDLSEIKYVPENAFPAIKRYRIYCEDIFISVAGSLGIVGKVPKELHGANLTENADKITNITCSQDFLLHVLMSPYIQRTIEALQTVGAQPKLALTRIRKFAIPYPPILEQRAIADALSDVDGLLAALDRLIAKKAALKQAAMQKLLTGQARLPGFEGKWHTKRIGEFADCTAGGTPSTLIQSYWGGAIRWMSSGELHLKRVHDVVGRITEEGLQNSSTKLIPPKCVLIGLAGQGRTRGTVAMNLVELCTNQSIAAVLPNSAFIPEYLYYNLETRYDELRDLSSGDGGRGGLNLTIIGSIAVPFPSIAEQTAIANALTDMDAELTALERRREKIRSLKQGMMQELLTGRTRLI